MKIIIGKNTKQPEGYSAFTLLPFPDKRLLDIPKLILLKATEAERLIGKLDGITHTLPDVDFFLSMFVAKDAAASAQIEGTQATIVDAIEKDAGLASKTTDADDIIFYIKALNYGLNRLKDFPFSLRLIREIHEQLMTDARATHFSAPGEFRKSQNWIGGTTPSNASFVPPAVQDMHSALADLEFFLHADTATIPVIQAALVHAQFETIHPFLDGNGRTGRLLITMLLCHRQLLERPVLFLSSYFRKHRKIYYQRLMDYHDGQIDKWLDFFLDGVINTANEAIAISKKITQLREEDMAKIQALGKREANSSVIVIRKLFSQPIVSSRSIMEWTGFSRMGAQKLIERFVKLGILSNRDQQTTYDRTYSYKNYLNIFID
ncbi:MAG: Fic family protein [bacterium]|nr:Fic family protein [bacterium]